LNAVDSGLFDVCIAVSNDKAVSIETRSEIMPAITSRIPQLTQVSKATLQIIAKVIFFAPNELSIDDPGWSLCFDKLVKKKYNIRGFVELDAFIYWCTGNHIPPDLGKRTYRLYCQAVLERLHKGLVEKCFKHSKTAMFTTAKSMKLSLERSILPARSSANHERNALLSPVQTAAALNIVFDLPHVVELFDCRVCKNLKEKGL
jgi:hypothetical protein